MSKGEQDPLQMSGAVTDLEDAIPFDKRNHAHDPVFPAIERNGRRDQIVGEGELVIEQTEEEPQDRFHWRSSPVDTRSRPMNKRSTTGKAAL